MQDHAINRQRVLDSFLELLPLNSTSRHEHAMAQPVMGLLANLGAEIITDNAAEALGGDTNNIIARIPGTVDAPAILFCAHIDTVAPTEGIQVRREDGTISTDGTTILGADDKAGVAAIFEMLHVLQEKQLPHPPLEIVFTVAEEIGVMGSMVLDYALLTAKCGFVPDSTGPVGLIVTRAPAQQHLQITVTGRSAHAGMNPEDGISAIAVAARAIAAMKQGRIDEETTANIGTIHGGKATNIVPESVTLEGEARSRDPRKLAAQVEHMRACFLHAANEAGATATVEVTDVYPAFNLNAESRAVTLAQAALAQLHLPALVTSTGGGSDANFFNNHGIETVILSAGYQHAHSHQECIAEDQLALLAQCLVNIAVLATQQD